MNHPRRATVSNSAKHFPYFTKREHDAALDEFMAVASEATNPKRGRAKKARIA